MTDQSLEIEMPCDLISPAHIFDKSFKITIPRKTDWLGRLLLYPLRIGKVSSIRCLYRSILKDIFENVQSPDIYLLNRH